MRLRNVVCYRFQINFNSWVLSLATRVGSGCSVKSSAVSIGKTIDQCRQWQIHKAPMLHFSYIHIFIIAFTYLLLAASAFICSLNCVVKSSVASSSRKERANEIKKCGRIASNVKRRTYHPNHLAITVNQPQSQSPCSMLRLRIPVWVLCMYQDRIISNDFVSWRKREKERQCATKKLTSNSSSSSNSSNTFTLVTSFSAVAFFGVDIF